MAKTPAASKYETKDSAADSSTDAAGTAGTPEGAGTAYTDAASASENTNGKASASAAGGNPVTSPVIGNPGEARPEMAYDYGLAGAPQQASQALTASEVLAAKATPDPRDQEIALLRQQLALAQTGGTIAAAAPAVKVAPPKYARRVRAVRKGHYSGLREAGEEFDNDLNLATFPEDPNSWFEAAE